MAAQTLQVALAPVVAMSRAVLDQLVGPREVEVEFGVEFTAEAGAVITKAAGARHLTVTLTWGGEMGSVPAALVGPAGQGVG